MLLVTYSDKKAKRLQTNNDKKYGEIKGKLQSERKFLQEVVKKRLIDTVRTALMPAEG